MQMYLLSDNHDTLTGMRLCGIEGSIVRDRAELLKKLSELMARRDLGIILITERLVSLAAEKIDEYRQNVRVPLLVSVPDRHGTNKPEDFLTAYVRDAIGVNL